MRTSRKKFLMRNIFQSFRIEYAGYPNQGYTERAYSRISSGPYGLDLTGNWLGLRGIELLLNVPHSGARDLHAARERINGTLGPGIQLSLISGVYRIRILLNRFIFRVLKLIIPKYLRGITYRSYRHFLKLITLPSHFRNKHIKREFQRFK
jgi:hypothetical protein